MNDSRDGEVWWLPPCNNLFMFKKNSSFRSFALTFAVGAAVGAAVALLYAPMTGRKMQRKLADATERVKDIVDDSVGNVQSVLRKVASA